MPPAPSSPAAPFDPDPEVTEQTLSDICRAHSSLGDIAYLRGTNLASLILWMNRPDIAARIDQCEATFARHQRLAAVNNLPAVTRCLTTIIHEFNDADPPSDPDLRLRQAESARRASTTLLRLARFQPGYARPSVPRPGSVGRGSPSDTSSFDLEPPVAPPPLSPPGRDAAALSGREGSPSTSPPILDEPPAQLRAEDTSPTSSSHPTDDPLDHDIIDEHGEIRLPVLAAAALELRNYQLNKHRTTLPTPEDAEAFATFDKLYNSVQLAIREQDAERAICELGGDIHAPVLNGRTAHNDRTTNHPPPSTHPP